MNKTLLTLSIASLALACYAKAPVRHMSSSTLGIEYSSRWRGTSITQAQVMAREQVQMLSFELAPHEIVQFGFGIGLDRMNVDEYNDRRFSGNYGLTGALRLSLNTPAVFGKIVRLSGNFDAWYLNCEDDFGYRYSGPVLSPSLGVLLHLGRYVDLEAGGRGLLIDGTMEYTKQSATSAPFSNFHQSRGYLLLTLTAPSGAFAQLSVDASRMATTELSDGPEEASVGFAIGVLLSADRKSERMLEQSNDYFPAFREMKEREKEMAEEIGEK
jgi:hypothetical protein